MLRIVAFLSLLLLAASASAQDLTSPLLFHASFDGNLNAVARGEGKPAKIVGPVEFRPGKFGQALLCGEGGASVYYASPGNLRAAAGTLEMWVCPVDWTGQEEESHKFLEALNPGWLLFYKYPPGGLTMLLGPDQAHYRTNLGPRFQWKPGEWHHLAATWRGTGLEIYVDGKLLEQSVNKQLFQAANLLDVPERLGDSFRIGDTAWEPARKRQTLVAEVKLYGAPLDAAAIARAARGEPVQFQPQLVQQVNADPDAGKLRVMCDAAGLVGDGGAGRSARVDLVLKGQQAPVTSAEITTFPHDVGHGELSVGDVPEGDYEVRTTLLGEGGAKIAQAVSAFHKPGPPVWSGNTLGLEDKVLPPWTPLQADAKAPALECWGRRYEFGAFLKQVRSAGADLLSGPVTLEATVEGQPVALSVPVGRLEGSTATRATLTGQADLASLRVTTRHELEYDGFTWTDLTVEPTPTTPSVHLDELRLTWLMPKSQATLMHSDQGSWGGNPAGALPAAGWSSAFTHFFWLGNEDRGLSWYAESNQNWLSSDKPAIQFVPEGDQVRVIVRLLAAPTTVTKKLDYGFGMMATPVRPQPPDVQRWRMTPGEQNPGVHPTFHIIWPTGAEKWYGSTEPANPAAFAARVKARHDRDCLVLPYVNLNFASAGLPEWQYYGPRWMDDPLRAWGADTAADVAEMGYSTMGTCPAIRDWQDFILYRINEMIDRYGVDGIYIDCWGPYASQAPPCGWRDEGGGLHTIRPIRGYRALLKRVYTLFHDKRPNPLLMVHMSAMVNIPMLSFTDTILDGEQFGPKGDYLVILPPDKFRAEFLGRNWGPVEFFLPEFRDPYTKSGTPDLAAYLLLHDVNAWPLWSDAAEWNRLYETLDVVGIAAARFQPYWKNSGVEADPRVLISSYVGKTGTVLAVMNTGEALDAVLTLNLAQLGLKRVGTAVDVLRGEPAKVEGNTLTVALARHQGRVLVLNP